MRCPKCGYISFDHLENCLKCKKSLASVAVLLHGTTYGTQAPAFLRFSTEDSAPEKEEVLDLFEDVVEEVEIEDPDLDILTAEPAAAENETDARLAHLQLSEADITPELSVSEEEPAAPAALSSLEEIASDSQWLEDIPDLPADAPAFSETDLPAISLEATESGTQTAPVFSFVEDEEDDQALPAALADISDLAPPGKSGTPVQTRNSAVDNLDLDLDLDLDMDLDLEDMTPDTDGAIKTAAPVITAQSSSSILAKAAASKGSQRPSSTVDMDEDLDFELDLGGLSLHKDWPAQKE